MKAMIFAAGLGTRLRPLTNDRPKALVEVAGKPMLQRVIERLKAAGVDEVVINIHYFGDKVTEFLEQNDNFGLTVHISDERQWSDEPLETGGGILKARQWLEGDTPFIVHNADILTDLDLSAFYRNHCEHAALASLLVKERNTQRYILFGEDNRLHGWTNIATGEVKPKGVDLDLNALSKRAFGGVHIISPEIFPLLEEYAAGRLAFGIIPFYLDACQHYPIYGYEPQEAYTWFDIGKPETLKTAEAFFRSF
jgi:NDP-sugar pyrophosphorylase family protein